MVFSALLYLKYRNSSQFSGLYCPFLDVTSSDLVKELLLHLSAGVSSLLFSAVWKPTVFKNHLLLLLLSFFFLMYCFSLHHRSSEDLSSLVQQFNQNLNFHTQTLLPSSFSAPTYFPKHVKLISTHFVFLFTIFSYLFYFSNSRGGYEILPKIRNQKLAGSLIASRGQTQTGNKGSGLFLLLWFLMYFEFLRSVFQIITPPLMMKISTCNCRIWRCEGFFTANIKPRNEIHERGS